MGESLPERWAAGSEGGKAAVSLPICGFKLMYQKSQIGHNNRLSGRSILSSLINITLMTT